MKEFLNVIPITLYCIVGVISLIMAFKCLFSNKFLYFHEKAAGKQWDEIGDQLQFVILSLMRVSGLSFLLVAILLMVFPIYNYYVPNIFLKYSAPLIAIIYCAGLFIINYVLYKNTKAETPWKNSLLALLFIIVGMLISILSTY